MTDLKLHKLLTAIAILCAIGALAATSALYTKVNRLETKQGQVLSTPAPLIVLPTTSPTASASATTRGRLK